MKALQQNYRPRFTVIELSLKAAITAGCDLSVPTSTAASHDATYRFALFIISP